MISIRYFFFFLLKTYNATPHLSCLDKAVQISDHNIWFSAEFTKLSLIIAKYSLLSSSVCS